MIARVLTVLGGYLLFSAMGDDRLPAGIALWAGTILVGWYVIDLVTGKPPTDLGRWGAILGGLCVAAGIVLAV